MKKDITPERKFLIERLGYFRNKAGLSARELSQRLGFSIAYIAKFENGDFNIPSEVLLDAMKICNITPSEFFSQKLEDYKRESELITNFNVLSEENKRTIETLIRTLKK